MPRGIERLTCLRTLDKVVVSGDKKACKFECLRNLNHLGGQLWMKCRGGVDVGEINKAEFKNKTKLLGLWALLSSEVSNEEALEDFQPPPNLEELTLSGYRGASRLSLNWMMSLTKLKKLELGSWSCFERLSLAKLPCLESLSIWKMESVKSVGDEFVGMESDNISSFSSSSLLIAFRKLQSLQIAGMEDWEEWDCGASGRGEEQIKIMPCLRSLRIYSCPKLKTLPDYLLQSTTLEELDIHYSFSDILERRYRVEEAENWVKDCGIPKIRIYENPMFSDDLESSSP
ncbi:hypothetical protein Dsin_014124 [Dipteronia sinensis]|uniref:R13L1/DRL21-like LRR repeat region domain-containing protein n=1 Tax=Dipteronia sinensis TaxID=43782 RepID=A0AAE0AMH0_9ROSI|nr:hypothetical protein Dsin_014124 [Dipteronia sinensis]